MTTPSIRNHAVSCAETHGGMSSALAEPAAEDEPSIPGGKRSPAALASKVQRFLSIGTLLFVISSIPQASAASSEGGSSGAVHAVEAALIPVLVIISGILAGLTLGFMSLDMTVLAVLDKTGSPKQQKAARAIMPIRKDGHLLLITLILANMIVNETLPIIADPVLGGGVQAVVISTALIVIFSEIIPQSICTRYGLQIGAKMVWPVRVLIWIFFVIAWPVSKLLTYLLGAHDGVIYRRSELKELVAMHGADKPDARGDLEPDTVNIVAGALDFQAKSVIDAMTPIATTFMLNLKTTKLDYETLGKILQSGHSRIPVYEEVEAPKTDKDETPARKIVGVILTKQFILLDPEDATPLKDLPILALPTVPDNLPLHSMLNTFQLGRSHIAVVAPLLPQFRPQKDSDSSTVITEGPSSSTSHGREGGFLRSFFRRGSSSSKGSDDEGESSKKAEEGRNNSYRMAEAGDLIKMQGSHVDMLTAMADVEHPVGIITLEDVLEELIGEEIADEFDVGPDGKSSLKPYIPAEYHTQIKKQREVAIAEKPAKPAVVSRPTFPLFSRANTTAKVEKSSTQLSGDQEKKQDAAKPERSESAEKPSLQSKPSAFGVMRTAAGHLLPTRSRSTPARRRSVDVNNVPESPIPPQVYANQPPVASPLATGGAEGEDAQANAGLYLVPEATRSSASVGNADQQNEGTRILPTNRRHSLDDATPTRHSSAPPASSKDAVADSQQYAKAATNYALRPDHVLSDAALERGRRQATRLATAHSLATQSSSPQLMFPKDASIPPASSSSAPSRTKIFKLAQSGVATPTRTPTPAVESKPEESKAGADTE